MLSEKAVYTELKLLKIKMYLYFHTWYGISYFQYYSTANPVPPPFLDIISIRKVQKLCPSTQIQNNL